MDQRILRRLRRSPGSLLALVALLMSALLFNNGTALAATPFNLPTTTCSLSGSIRSCDLWAKTGSITVTGTNGVSTSIPIWGYSDTETGSAGLPGPALIINQGETVQVTLHNSLSEPTSMTFVGQGLPTDMVGAAAAGTKTYTFQATRPGTFLYEAGLVPGSPTAVGGVRQVMLGMYGALIVRPTAAGLAYGTTASSYDDEALLVYSEIDPAFNTLTLAGLRTFKMNTFAPKYQLINGKTYPNTDPIATDAGRRLLLRQINAGSRSRSYGALGLPGSVVAIAGEETVAPIRVAAQTIAAGQTVDTIIAVPATTPSGSQYAFYDTGALSAGRTGATAFNGAVTLITVGATNVNPSDTTGPVTSGVTVTPIANSTNVTLAAAISDATTGNANVIDAEYSIDSSAATPITITTPAASVNVSVIVDVSTLTPGQHTISVRGKDALNNWGAPSLAFVQIAAIDTAGPSVTSDTIAPNPTNGSGSVALQVTANDTTSGNSNVDTAEYFIDTIGTTGSGNPLNLTSVGANPIASFAANVPVGTLNEGTRNILIHTRDVAGNWGAYVTLPLTVDKTAPTPSALVVDPSPNNGTLVYGGVTGGATNGVRVSATLTDPISGGVRSNVVSGEVFIDSVGAAGSGFLMQPVDGQFNTSAETAYAIIPSSIVQRLTNGSHTIYVVGVDTAGNRTAPPVASALVIDKTAPTITGAVTLTPAAANNSAVAISATASDVATGNSTIAGGEFFIDTAGIAGTGTAMTPGAAAPATTINGSIPAATIAALSVGNHTVYVHAKDAAGNWGTTFTSAILLIDRTAPSFSSMSINPTSISVGTATVALTVAGTDTGGSGVAGGEYWFDGTTTPPAITTPFNGLTASINTSALTAGNHNVRVRIRDVAGNWSTGNNGVRTATLTVTAPIPDAIFSDGFEAPTTLPGNWTSRSTTTTSRLNVTTGAALVGTNGLQAQGNNTNYVQYNFGTNANPATATYDARFYFRPNGNTSTGQDIFAAATSSSFNTTLFRVRYRLNAGQTQVQIQVGTNNTNTTWTNINSTTNNRIEVVWQAAGSTGPNPGTLVLYVNGVSAQSLTTVSPNSVGAVRLGSVTSGGNTATALEFFDAFASKRSVSPLIGP